MLSVFFRFLLQICAHFSQLLLELFRASEALDDLTALVEQHRLAGDRAAELQALLALARARYIMSLDQQDFALAARATDEEAFRLADLATLVSNMTGTPVVHVDNPRKEAERNDLLVDNRSLTGLGLKPITLQAHLLEEISNVARKYAHNCDRTKIPARSRW